MNTRINTILNYSAVYGCWAVNTLAHHPVLQPHRVSATDAALAIGLASLSITSDAIVSAGGMPSPVDILVVSAKRIGIAYATEPDCLPQRLLSKITSVVSRLL